MAERYLVDTNILFYHFAGEIPEREIKRIEKIFKTSFNISIITRMEFLGGKKAY
jgi:predicted nucleic acid-binding protein